MGTISEKLVYLNGTKQAIKNAINEDFEVVYDKGKNLFDGILEIGNFNSNTGEKIANNDYIINTNPIPVEELTNYKISSNGTGIRMYVFEYKEDMTYNLSTRKTVNADSYLTTNSGTKYINFRTIDANTNLQEKIQVEKGTTASTYEPYVEETTFREYADKISSNNAKYKDLIPKETTNATNTLDISNSSGLDKALVTQYGNTYQETTTGKNLFDVNLVTSVTNGSISDEIITTNETSDSTYSVFPYFSNISLPANTYYLSMDIRIKSGKGYFNKINDAATDWTAVSKPSLSTTFQRYVYSHTYTSVTTLNHILIQFINSTNAVYEITNIMLSTSSDTNFEKYTGGNPAPNPDYPQEIVNISGKSTLKDVGKNLFDVSTIIEGKVINASGDLVNSAQWDTTNDYQAVNSNTITISCKTTGSVNGLLIEYDENKNFIQRQQKTGTSSTATLNANTKYIRYSYQNTIGMYDIQIEQGSTVTDYEPYQEQSFDLDLKSKNLWGEEEHGGIDESTGQDIYNANRWRTIGYINVTPNTSYTISSNASSNIWNIFYYYDINKTFIRSQAINGKEVSATTPSNCFYMRCVIGDTNTTTTTQRQLEKGSTATDYEPFYDINLCKILDYKDRIYPLNGKWYLENFSEKVTIDGTNIAVTNRRETNTSGNYSFTFLFSKKAKRADGTITQGGYCNKLISKPRNNIYGKTQGFGYGATNNDYWGDIVIFRTDWATKTVADVNTDLKSNPIELEYLLDSAETIEITESNYPTLYNQLNNIKLFEGVNHITMTNESGLDVEFDIEYYKDWKLD